MEMKKYTTPEMEVVKLRGPQVLLEASGEVPGSGGQLPGEGPDE